jgi:hypothetical protein
MHAFTGIVRAQGRSPYAQVTHTPLPHAQRQRRTHTLKRPEHTHRPGETERERREREESVREGRRHTRKTHLPNAQVLTHLGTHAVETHQEQRTMTHSELTLASTMDHMARYGLGVRIA